MRTLAIDTSGPVLSVALFDGGTLLAADNRTMARGHAEQLIPAIAALPDGGRAERILVACGPGSFTGIRVGIAAARALGFAWDAKVQGFDSLALIALAANLPEDTPRAVAVPGGHGELFIAGPGLSPTSMTVEAAAQALVTPDIVGASAAQVVALRGTGTAHDAFADARLALRLGTTALLPSAQPVYGRPPDAKPVVAA